MLYSYGVNRLRGVPLTQRATRPGLCAICKHPWNLLRSSYQAYMTSCCEISRLHPKIPIVNGHAHECDGGTDDGIRMADGRAGYSIFAMDLKPAATRFGLDHGPPKLFQKTPLRRIHFAAWQLLPGLQSYRPHTSAYGSFEIWVGNTIGF